MANSVEDIYIKLGVDTKAFDGSMSSIKKEMASLRGLIGSNLISPQDSAALSARFGQLKDDMEDIKFAAGAINTQDTFGNLARAGGIAAAATGAVVGGMSLLGIESKKAQEIQTKVLTLISISSALQQIADAKRLRGLIVEYAAMLKNLVLFKSQNVLLIEQASATGALTVAQAIQTKGVGLATKAQLIWNAVMAANPVMLLVIAIAALVAGIIALVSWMGKSSKEIKAQNEALEEYNKSLDEWAKSNENISDSNEQLINDIKVLNNEMTQAEADRAQARIDSNNKMEEADAKYLEFVKKINEDEILTDQQKNEELIRAKSELQVQKQELDENYQLTLQRINDKEVVDNKKLEEQKAKDAKTARDQKAKEEEQARKDRLTAEIAWQTYLNNRALEQGKAGIAGQLTKGTEKAWDDFNKQSIKSFNELNTEIGNIINDVSTTFENSIGNKFRITSTGIQALDAQHVKLSNGLMLVKGQIKLITDAYSIMGEEASKALIVFNSTDIKSLLAQIMSDYNNYYRDLGSANYLAKEDNIQIEEDNFIKNKALLLKSLNTDLDLNKNNEDKKAALRNKYKEDVIKLENIKNDNIIKLTTEYGVVLDGLEKARVDNRVEYEKKALNDVISINKSAIDQITAGLSNTKKGSDEYNKLLITRSTLIGRTIQDYEYLIEVVKKEIEASNKTPDEKLRDTEAATKDLTQAVKELNSAYEEQQVILSDQITAMQAFALATQSSAELTQMFLENSMDNFASFVEEEQNRIQESYDNSLNGLNYLLDRKLISEQDYNKKVAALEAEKAKKEKKLKQDQWKKEKQANIISAIINTAVAVTQALASGPPPLSWVMAAINGVLGGVEIGLISSQEMPSFKKGGKVNYAVGGMLDGPSHERGGVPIMAEGGEFIIQKSVAQKPGMDLFLNKINTGGLNTSQTTTATIDEDTLRKIVQEVKSIPVVVSETDITRTQRKVSTIETASSW